jgi:hypothetical protein
MDLTIRLATEGGIKRCQGCGKVEKKMTRCKGCEEVWYCGKVCFLLIPLLMAISGKEANADLNRNAKSKDGPRVVIRVSVRFSRL